jgi:23S rRNA pseudouridine2605 synthase
LTRLQKVLAKAGFASRRKAEEIILSGRVRVNGKVMRELGAKADPEKDKVEVDGRRLALETPVTLLMNKPRGVVCTVSDPEGRDTVIDLVRGVKARLFPVGRLDFATSGAVLLTNDGELAYALTHPRFGVEKTYLIKIRGQASDDVLSKWRNGVDIGDVVTRPAKVFKVEEEENYTWIEVTIREGRNRQIRRMGEATGIDVIKLKRIAFAGLTIKELKAGQYRRLTEKELARLKRDYSSQPKKARRTAVGKRRKDRPRDRKDNT